MRAGQAKVPSICKPPSRQTSPFAENLNDAPPVINRRTSSWKVRDYDTDGSVSRTMLADRVRSALHRRAD